LRYIIESFNKNNTTIVVFQDTVKKNIDEHYIIPKRTVMQDYGEYTQKLNNPTSSNETTPTLPIGGSKKHKKHKKTKKNKTKKNKTNLNKNISTSIGGSKKHNKTKKNKTKKL
jgi:effector-binding domain-containing protein